MNPSHHPQIETLAAYAAGQMRAGFELVVAAHLRGCAQCRSEVARLETLGGSLIEDIAPVALEASALEATLARLDRPAPAPNPRSLQSLLTPTRRRWVAPRVWVAKIDTPHDPEDRVFLLGVGAGGVTAEHGHAGEELMQVLSGSLQDGEITYRAGDMAEMEPGASHHPRLAGKEDCICLFATHGRLRPKSLGGRIAFALAGV